MTVLEQEMMMAIIRMAEAIEKLEKAAQVIAVQSEKQSKILESIDARLARI